ncbi:MAG TPA: hypothetical protein DCE42_20425, partial [Myxococcales bacterium]|nr:hypothetical protein [Myxococcales bacterium]
DAIEDGVDAIGGAIRSLGNAKSRGQLGQQLRQGARNVARRAHDTADLNNDGRLSARDLMFGARYVGDAVVDTAEDVVEAVDKGLDIAADAIVDGADALADGVQDVGRGIAQGARWTAEKVDDGIDASVDAAKDAAAWTRGKAKEGAAWVNKQAHRVADRDKDGDIDFTDVSVGAGQVRDLAKEGIDATGRAIKQGKTYVTTKAKEAGKWAHDKVDINDDGKINFADAKAAADASVRVAKEAKDAAISRLKKAGKWAHDKVDLNDDGKINFADAKYVGNEVKEAASYVKKKATAFGKEVGRQFSQAAETISDATTRTYIRAQGAVSRLVRFFGG